MELNEWDLSLIIATGCSLIIVLLLLLGYSMWKYCSSSSELKTDTSAQLECVSQISRNSPCYSAVFVDGKNLSMSRSNSTRVVELIPEQDTSHYHLYKNHSFSHHTKHHYPKRYAVKNICDTVDGTDYKRHSCYRQNVSVEVSLEDCSLPQISEFCAKPCQYASSSILDESYTANELSIKTRSLPSSVRLKKRPVSAIENYTDLYDKVNFTKKRKNRMRCDEAAIIALSRSRSQHLNKDTDGLVDNEAVVVYDERTAL